MGSVSLSCCAYTCVILWLVIQLLVHGQHSPYLCSVLALIFTVSLDTKREGTIPILSNRLMPTSNYMMSPCCPFDIIHVHKFHTLLPSFAENL